MSVSLYQTSSDTSQS